MGAAVSAALAPIAGMAKAEAECPGGSAGDADGAALGVAQPPDGTSVVSIVTHVPSGRRQFTGDW